MKPLVLSAAAAFTASFTAASGPLLAADAQELLKEKACLSCHTVDKKLVGPAYKEVAAKYKSRKDAEAYLDLYLAATSLYAGPTSFLSTVWQLRQAFSFKSSCASAARRGPLAAVNDAVNAAAADSTRGFMKFSGKVKKFLRKCYCISCGLDTCSSRSSRRSMGARQVTPSHTQALTSAPAGLARAGGKSRNSVPAAITVVCGR